jgi:type IV pilus assembly protein PilO
MDKFLEKFAKIPALQKLLGLGVVILIVFGVTYSVFVQSAIDEIAANDAALETKRKKQMELQLKANYLQQFQREVEKLKTRLREAEDQLPKSAEIEKLLRDVSFEAAQSGLVIETVDVRAEKAQGEFAAVPMALSVRGAYHELGVFFDRLSRMPRIVNVTRLSLAEPESENKKIILSASFIATSYRFLDTK